MLEQQLRQSCNCPEQALRPHFSLTQSLFITETNPNNVVSYTLGSSSLTVAAGLPNSASGPYSPTQDGNSALSSPLNAPRGITVDTFGNFSLADSSNSIVRKLSSNIIFPSIGSQSATMPITFVVNENINLSAASGPDFCITSNTCTGSLIPAAAGTIPNTWVFLRFTPIRPGLRGASVKLTDSLLQNHSPRPAGSCHRATQHLHAWHRQHHREYAAAPDAVTVDSNGNAYVLEAGNTPTAICVDGFDNLYTRERHRSRTHRDADRR